LIERHESLEGVILAGIPTRGVEVARRIMAEVKSVEGVELELGVVDISMHRDDLATRDRLTAVTATQLPLDLDGRTVVLVDDVFYTGRSVRAALDAIASYGRPGRIELAVLIDRGHRELPIAADYVGKMVVTRPSEKVRVRFANLDGEPDSVRVADYSAMEGVG
jgi:pyrimidine operon attenuation protein/uracil phosphoribosyltransferase